MCDHDDGLVSEHPTNAVLEYVFSHVRVHSGEHVIQQIYVGLSVHCTGQAHPLLLAPGEIDAEKLTVQDNTARMYAAPEETGVVRGKHAGGGGGSTMVLSI